jgi:hypothetical protein
MAQYRFHLACECGYTEASEWFPYNGPERPQTLEDMYPPGAVMDSAATHGCPRCDTGEGQSNKRRWIEWREEPLATPG